MMGKYTSDFYDSIFKRGGWNKEYFKIPEKCIYYPVWSKVLTHLNVNDRILELGCGAGQFAYLVFKKGFNYLKGIDFSLEAIKLAKKFNPEKKDLFIQGDLEDRSLYSGDYNTVILNEVLEHLQYDQLVLAFIREGTKVVFTVPDYMGTGHVRIFKNKREIEQRYGIYLIDIQQIDSIKVTKESTIFVVKGMSKCK